VTIRTCSYETELAQALKAGQWPDGCPPELRTHAEICRSCNDLVLVTQAFQSARRESCATVPDDLASLLWWRAQLRRRNSANQRTSRPISIAQTFALFVNVAVAIVFAAWQYHHGLRWASWWSEMGLSRLLHLFDIGSRLDGNLVLLICSIAMLAILSGLVVYLVSEKS
jgi:hypothetical protein